jgi:hypothetical protein
MSDKPFIGYPQALKPPGKRKLYQDTWLDDFVKGLFGAEAPTGSVLEPDREKRVKASNAGQITSIATDALDLPKAALLAVAALGGMVVGAPRTLVERAVLLVS